MKKGFVYLKKWDHLPSCRFGKPSLHIANVHTAYQVWDATLSLVCLESCKTYVHTLMFLQCVLLLYIRVNKNLSAWNFLSPKPEMTCGTVSIIIRVVLLSPYLRIRAVSLSFIHYNQSHRVYINRIRQYICLIWN